MVNTAKNVLITLKKSATDPLKTSSKRGIQKPAEATGNLIANIIADRITKASRRSPQSNSEEIIKKHGKEIPTQRYISPEKRQKSIDDLRLI